MWTSIRNVKFFKNALEYNVYHRCLCNFLSPLSVILTFSRHFSLCVMKNYLISNFSTIIISQSNYELYLERIKTEKHCYFWHV